MSRVWGTNRFSVKWRFLLDIVPSLDIISFAVSLATRKNTSPHILQTAKTAQWPRLNLKPPLLFTLRPPRLRSLPPPRARRKPLKLSADGFARPPRCQPPLQLLKPPRPQVPLRPGDPPVTQTRGLFYLQGPHGPQQTPVEVPLKSTVQTAL